MHSCTRHSYPASSHVFLSTGIDLEIVNYWRHPETPPGDALWGVKTMPFRIVGALATTPVWIAGSIVVSMLQLGIVIYNSSRIGIDLLVWWVAGVLRWMVMWLSSPWAFGSQRRQREALEMKLQRAQTYDEWLSTANSLDRMTGSDGWRRSVESPDYDSRIVASMLGQIRTARKTEQTQEMMFLLGSALHRRFGSIDRSVLCETRLHTCIAVVASRWASLNQPLVSVAF